MTPVAGRDDCRGEGPWDPAARDPEAGLVTTTDLGAAIMCDRLRDF
jgi:hypothetical protein